MKAVSPHGLEKLAVLLAPKVAELVFARLAAVLSTTADPYSTRAGGEPPEFRARAKKWRAVAPSIPGAVRLGRWVSVPRAAYAAWVESQATPAKSANASAWSPAAALRAVGIRGSR